MQQPVISHLRASLSKFQDMAYAVLLKIIARGWRLRSSENLLQLEKTLLNIILALICHGEKNSENVVI